MSPFALPDGHDFPRLFDELVPGFAAQGDESHIDRMILACFVLGLSTRRVPGRSECAGTKTKGQLHFVQFLREGIAPKARFSPTPGQCKLTGDRFTTQIGASELLKSVDCRSALSRSSRTETR